MVFIVLFNASLILFNTLRQKNSNRTSTNSVSPSGTFLNSIGISYIQ
ncbi:hypothetical protein [uncultured Gammaproteobacteria bacterium]|nr:hypothetical protein [uncultured Gammaproteobacteria bacterium]